MEHWEGITSELVALADQLERLTPEQWATQSLCSAWSVRDVVAHLVAPRATSAPRLALSFSAAFLAARGNFDRANVRLTAKAAKRSTPDLVAALRQSAGSHFKPPGFGSEAPLADVLIHGQDIRIPLGLPTEGPIDRWRAVLDMLMQPKTQRAFGSVSPDGFRFAATDLEWSSGAGAEVSGPAIALALTIMRRDARIEDLTGPGVSKLTAGIAG